MVDVTAIYDGERAFSWVSKSEGRGRKKREHTAIKRHVL